MTELGNNVGADSGQVPLPPDDTTWPFAPTRSEISDSALFRTGVAAFTGSGGHRWPLSDEQDDRDRLAEGEIDESEVRGGGWLQGAAVLVAVFVAFSAGMAALWNTSSPSLDSTDVPVSDQAPPTVASEPVPSVLPTTSVPTEPSVVPPAAVTQPSAWVTVDNPSSSFVIALPTDPDASPLPGEGTRLTSPGPFGSKLVVSEQTFPAGAPEINDLGMIAGANEAMSGQPHQGEFATLIGGSRMYEFTGVVGDVTVRGRSLLVGNRRVVLVQEVPSSASDEPEAVAAFERMVSSFQPR